MKYKVAYYKMGELVYDNFDDLDKLDDLYKFHIGGQTSLRGWKSPKDYDKHGALMNDLVNLLSILFYSYIFIIKFKYSTYNNHYTKWSKPMITYRFLEI